MSGENRKSKKPTCLKLVGLALLLVTSGITLTACQKPQPEGKSTEQLKEEQPAKSNQKESDEQLKKKQPAKSDSKKSKQKQDDAEDTQIDDDPE